MWNACISALRHTKFTTSGAHDVIAITSSQKNDLCTEELKIYSWKLSQPTEVGSAFDT